MNPINEYVPAEGSGLNYTNHRQIRDGLNTLTQNQPDVILPGRANIFNTIVQNSANETENYYNNSLIEINRFEPMSQRRYNAEEILLNKSYLKIDHLENILENEKACFKKKSFQVVNHFEALLNKTQNLKKQLEREDAVMANRFNELKQQIKTMQTSFHTDFTNSFDKLMLNPLNHNTFKSTYTNTEATRQNSEEDEIIVCTKTNKNNKNAKILKTKENDKNK